MRYLIVEKEKGLFLGFWRGLFLFAKDNIFSISRSPSFETQLEAEAFIANYLVQDGGTYGVITVESNEKYVPIIDVITQGYQDYTHELMDFIPMISTAIH